MADLPLSFAVFYCCAIQNRSALSQHDIINMLFRGNYSRNCGPETILSSVCSAYAIGKRSPSRQIVAEICCCPHDELTRRFTHLGLQDFESGAANLLKLLKLTRPVNETELDRLLGIADSSNALSFLVAVFEVAIKCPSHNRVELNPELQNILSTGKFELLEETASEGSAVSDSESASAEASVPQMHSRIVEEFDGLSSEFELRISRLTFPDHENVITRYSNAFLKGSQPDGSVRPPFIHIENSEFQHFLKCLPEARKIFLVEALGTLPQLIRALRRISLPRSNTEVLLLLDISPELSNSDIRIIQRELSEICAATAIPHGARVSGKLVNTAFLRIFYTDNRINRPKPATLKNNHTPK